MHGLPRPTPRDMITGHAWLTGLAEYVVDPTVPFPTGLTVGDIWSR